MSFFTLSEPSEGEYKSQGSKFSSFVYPIKDEPEAKNLIKEFQKKYFDATHICYAYALGYHETLKAHDAGEPSHTAGTPILNAIRSEELTQVIVFVVRYFGGTKLGKPGLIQAYKSAAILCLKNAAKIPYEKLTILSFNVEYEKLPYALDFLKKNNCKIVSKKIDTICVLELEIREIQKIEIMDFFKKIGPQN